MKAMKRVVYLAALLLCAVAQAKEYQVHPEDMGVVGKDAPIVLGQWHLDWATCKAYAERNDMPMIAVWGNHNCVHCWALDSVFTNNDFKAWQQANNAGKVVSCIMFGGENGYPDQQWSEAYMWMRNGAARSFPMVCLYWPSKNVKKFYYGDAMRGNKAYYKINESVPDVIKNMENAFAGWVPPPDYAGGAFADPDTVGNRLEFEPGTASVRVGLSRTAKVATNVTFVVKGPTGAQLKSETINWPVNETNKTVELALSQEIKDACTSDGQQLTLYLREGGKDMSTNHVTFVKRDPSAANPKWLGESFDFGEWTCDYAAATNKARGATGAAYTLVSIQGSKWCPDCANTDRNFLDVKDGSANRFCAWAKEKQIALVSMDVPNYNASGSTPETVASPTLFSKKAFETTLARVREYPQSGADASLTNAIARSGLGYLTRKGATDAQAAEVMAKFHDLAVTNTDRGGFHRPEDTNAYRTGVPIFVLLRKDGTVAARFTRFASASPMAADQANFDNYIKRFEEMLALAASTGNHADPSEIENNYPGDRAISFAANGGTASNELCNADFQDAFKLTGVGGNADQRVLVRGASGAQVSAQFWQKAADGSFSTIGREATGKLSEGVVLTQSFTEGGDYYLLVKGANITNAEFAAANATANNFIGYEVTGSTVLVPQEDRVTANAPAGSDKVTIRLETDTVYCFSGVTTNDNPFLVEVAEASPFRFLTSTEVGDVELKVSTGPGGEITYQAWNPGQVGFAVTARSVPESVNDLRDDWVEFKVARTGGKSGRVKARVTVDQGRTTLDPERYVFQTNALNAADFTWEDGETSNMTARVKIIDDLFYAGDFKVVFNLEVLASDAGDVGVADRKGTFTLTVVEDDKQEPGTAFFCGTDPGFARKGVVYARASEGARIFAKRVESFDGLIAGVINSSAGGVEFKTEDERDLEKLADIAPELVELFPEYRDAQVLWWSSREGGEKSVRVSGIPAGRTAKVTFTPVNMKTISASNTVTVISVADDAPAFKTASAAFSLSRYVAEAPAAVAIDPATLTGGKVSVVKLSGTLPAGLKAVYDAANTNLAFTGAVTAKPGTYAVTYQVVETRAGTRVPGLTAAVTFTVTDPTDTRANPTGANPAVATARTFKDLAVVDPADRRLVGLLQLTIPPRGNLSGKYVSEAGTVSLKAKSWNGYDPMTKSLGATLDNLRSGIIVGVTVLTNGVVEALVNDVVAQRQFDVKPAGVQWSSQNTAEDWQGYYTVALPVEEVVTNATANLAPTGSGYLTLKLTGTAALKTGTFKWAGLLPNGTAVSGSSALGAPYEGKSSVQQPCRWANLPVFKSSSTDLLSVYLKIRDKSAEVRETDRRVIWSADGVDACWEHGERATSAADYAVDLGAYGALFDKSEDLGGCCQQYYQTTDMLLAFDVSSLVWTSFGVPAPVSPLKMTVGKDSITVKSGQATPPGFQFRLARSTGVVSGSLDLQCGGNKAVRANYKGVILPGWGEGCGCGEIQGQPLLPFVNGAFYFVDKVEYSSGGKTRSVSVKRGGLTSIDAEGSAL